MMGVRELAPGPRGIRLPREHGFWTMLAAAVFVAAGRSQPSAALLLAATATVTMAVLSGAALATSIRRRASLQVGSAGALSLVGIPIELAGGSEPASTVLTSLALAVVFTSSALCVRASFAIRNASPRACRVHTCSAAILHVP